MSVHLYQIQYDEKTKPKEDSGFKIFDVRKNPEFLKRETAHLVRFYDEVVSQGGDNDFYGLFSPRFGEKTGLVAKNVKDFVDDNSGVDVFLFNPYPMLVNRHVNVLQHGEWMHPGLLRLASQMFIAAGINFDPTFEFKNTVENTIYCNYWVAKKSFFDVFIPFIKSNDKAIEDMPSEMRDQYFSDVKYYTKACYYPFLFERLISFFLASDLGKDFTTKAYICQYQKKPLTPIFTIKVDSESTGKTVKGK